MTVNSQWEQVMQFIADDDNIKTYFTANLNFTKHLTPVHNNAIRLQRKYYSTCFHAQTDKQNLLKKLLHKILSNNNNFCLTHKSVSTVIKKK
jgi:sulfur relay (sulfurtransferase) DsrC/TusE family protein